MSTVIASTCRSQIMTTAVSMGEWIKKIDQTIKCHSSPEKENLCVCVCVIRWLNLEDMMLYEISPR